MKCPACYNTLSKVTVGPLTVDVCRGGCGGIWCDAFELQRVDEPQEPESDWLLNVERDPSIHVDFHRKRACPKCEGVKLKRHHFSAKRRLEVDQCPGCGGYWLDAGELARIRAEMEEAAQERELASRMEISTDLIRYIYQMKTAERDES